MNILVTGKPGVGKTTLIEKVIHGQKVSGFFTREIRENKKRVGFSIETVDGKTGILAHVTVESPVRVSKYRVNLKDIDEVCVPSLNQEGIIVIDEIGKMELFSKKFREKVVEVLDTRRVIATIMEQPHPFADRIKQRNDVRLFTVTQENRNHLVAILTAELKKMILNCSAE